MNMATFIAGLAVVLMLLQGKEEGHGMHRMPVCRIVCKASDGAGM